MLNLQKTLLRLLTSAQRPVGRLELTRLAFLLREEMSSQGGSTFYDFLPYKHGPFSFCLYLTPQSPHLASITPASKKRFP